MVLLLCSLWSSRLSLAALLPLLGFFLDLFPTTWVDPSGYSVESGAGDDLSLLLLMNVMGTGLANYLECFLDERCKALQLVMNDLGSQGANLVEWSAENLYDALFSTYPHEPTPVSPADLVFSLALSNTPIWGDLYDLATAVTGYDFVTGQYLAGWERLVTLVGVIPILGVAGANMRYGLRNANEFMSHGDELAKYIGRASNVTGRNGKSVSRYRVKYHYGYSAGVGSTDQFGNIWISPHGTRTDRLRALYHEQVHAFLTPKGRYSSLRHITLGLYSKSNIWRYMEEAAAESRALLKTGGKLSDGLLFPFTHGEPYVTPTALLAEVGLIGTVGYGSYIIWNELQP